MSPSEKAAFFDKVADLFEGVTAKENPAVTAAGFSNDSDQTGSCEFTGEEFVAAIRVVLQARAAIGNVMQYAQIVGAGRPIDDFDAPELSYAKASLSDAETAYRQMYRSQVRVDFSKILGVKKYDFEQAVLTLQRFFGGA